MTAPEPVEDDQPAAQPEPPSWDELFKGEDPTKVKEALENSRKWESRAKSNAEAAKKVAEFDKERRAAMSESERALSEAEGKGRTAAAQEYGKRLARSEFDAAAGRRNPDVDTAAVLEFIDLGRFVGEDGEPDQKAIKAAVERLVPAPSTGPPGFDGGARTSPTRGASMNDFIRKAAGRT